MKVKDILPPTPIKVIMVRTNDPFDEEPDGILFGYVGWDGKNFVNLDGDNYYLEDEVIRWSWEEDGSLTYWIHSDWVNGKGELI